MSDILKISNSVIRKKYQFFKPNCKYIITAYGCYKSNSPNNPKINNIIIKEHINIDDRIYIIHRHLLTFTQTDDTIRSLIHNMVYKLVKKYTKQYNSSFDQGILIGGEMYLYGKILNEFIIKKIYISDTESIVRDSKLNDPNKSNSIFEYVNYSTFKFTSNIQSINSIAICNVSKYGLGTNLCNQLIKTKPKIILSIWCSYKALEKDYEILKKSYNIINIFRYKTNYDVCLGVLESK